MNSDFDVTNVHGTEDIQEEESPRNQKQSLQGYMKRNYNNNDFLLGAFPDDTKLLTGGLKLILPSPDITPEPSNPPSIPDLPKATKVQKPRDTTQGMRESNIQEGKRERKPSEKAKARLQSYHAALSSPERLQAVHAAFRAGIGHKPGKIHQNDPPELPNT